MRPAPSPRRREGGGEGVTIGGLVPPSPPPSPRWGEGVPPRSHSEFQSSLLLPPHLRLERRNLSLGARRQHAYLAAAGIGHDHLQRLARTLQDRDVAGLGAARRQIEQ